MKASEKKCCSNCSFMSRNIIQKLCYCDNFWKSRKYEIEKSWSENCDEFESKYKVKEGIRRCPECGSDAVVATKDVMVYVEVNRKEAFKEITIINPAYFLNDSDPIECLNCGFCGSVGDLKLE